MSEGDPRKMLQDMNEALNKRDFDKAMSFFADDAVEVSPDGMFNGKAEVRRRTIQNPKHNPLIFAFRVGSKPLID